MDRGSQDSICDFCYQEYPSTERLNFHPGQIYSALICYPADRPQVLTVENYDPKEERVPLLLANYSAKQPPHYPVASLGLENDEVLAVHKAKKRPVIILGSIAAEWLVGKNPQKLYLCAPIFSFKQLHSQEFVLRVQAFCYPNLFYLPFASPGLPDESAVRFELIQPVQRGALQPWTSYPKGLPLALSEDAYGYFLNHLSQFLLGRPSEEFLDDLMAQYRKELLVAAGLAALS